MDLNHVAVFAKVVELESFTSAAQQLGLPKSSVSRTVTRLEEELGVQLLQRTTRQLHLTEAGHAYYERARLALTGLDEAASAATNMSADPRGSVRVTAPPGFGLLDLSQLVARFVRKYPLVHIDISLTSRYVDMVAEGFDVAIRAGKLRDSTLVARRIGTDSLGLYASPAYLRKRGRPKSLVELVDHDCVLFQGRLGKAEWRLNGPDGEERVTVRGPLNVDEMSFAQHAVAQGLGIGLLPIIGVRLGAAHAAIPAPVRLLPEYAMPGADLHVVTPPTRFQPASVTVFRHYLIEELSRMWNAATA